MSHHNRQHFKIEIFAFRAWLNYNAMFYTTFICFNVSEAKPLCFKPRPNGETLFGKHWKFCLSSTMFVGLATTQTGASQTFFACDKQKMFLKNFKNIDKCLLWWPNGQACLTSKVRNVWQTMLVRLAGASVFVHECLMMLSDVEYTTFKMFVTQMSNYLFVISFQLMFYKHCVIV